MNNYENFARINRMVGLTLCNEGYNDLFPESLDPDARWWERCEDFHAHSLHPYAKNRAFTPAWCPAYSTVDPEGEPCARADLMVFDLHGLSSHHLLQWLVNNDLAGLVHPTKSDSLVNPRSRLILLLHRSVSYSAYRNLWRRITRELFADVPLLAHQDFRQRFDQPRAVRGESVLLRHDGNPLFVDGALSLEHIEEDALGEVSAGYADDVNAPYWQLED